MDIFCDWDFNWNGHYDSTMGRITRYTCIFSFSSYSTEISFFLNVLSKIFRFFSNLSIFKPTYLCYLRLLISATKESRYARR
uniref:Uncharacterized protein n=1 Tax=Ascaris lumbricoides TaxID=6252 RepID=A0A0M3HIE0_ASCLU